MGHFQMNNSKSIFSCVELCLKTYIKHFVFCTQKLLFLSFFNNFLLFRKLLFFQHTFSVNFFSYLAMRWNIVEIPRFWQISSLPSYTPNTFQSNLTLFRGYYKLTHLQ